MKNLIIAALLFLLLGLSCKEPEPPAIIFKEPYLRDSTVDAGLLPYLGFNGFTGPLSVKFDFYCDTLNPPVHVVIENLTRDHFLGQRIPQNELLKPGKKYYWKCVAKHEGREVSTDIFTFTTIDPEKVDNSRWSIHCFLSQSTYQNILMDNYSYYAIELADTIVFGEVCGFSADGDSAKQVCYFGDPYETIFLQTVRFQFGLDSVSIGYHVYDFVNFGRQENAWNDSIYSLVVRRRQDQVIIVFNKN